MIHLAELMELTELLELVKLGLGVFSTLEPQILLECHSLFLEVSLLELLVQLPIFVGALLSFELLL